jgi:hypothetical protein
MLTIAAVQVLLACEITAFEAQSSSPTRKPTPKPLPEPAPENWSPLSPQSSRPIPSTPQPVRIHQPEALPQTQYVPSPLHEIRLERTADNPPPPPKPVVAFKAASAPSPSEAAPVVWGSSIRASSPAT